MSGSKEENRSMIQEEDRDLLGFSDDDLDDSSDDDSDFDDFGDDFKNYIKSTKLNCYHWKPMPAWVFWTEDSLVESEESPPTTHSSGGVPNSVPETLAANGKVTDKIRSVIRNFIITFESAFESDKRDCLIQFWAPKRDGDRCVLTTADQPFGLWQKTKILSDFRMKCMKYKFYVDAKSADDPGVLGYVFRQNEVAFTPEVKYYTNEEYPQRYDAIKLQVQTSRAFPVIEPSTRCCVGVLELLSTDSIYISPTFSRVNQEIQVAGLKSTDAFGHAFPSVHNNKAYNQVLEEISKGMKVVCETHKLLMGQIWTSCSCCRDVKLGGSCSMCYDSCKGQVMSTRPWREVSYVLEKDIKNFVYSCDDDFLRTGHGVGGRALLSYSPCFCKDVTRFKKTEYPLVHIARMCGLTSCFAICLRSNCTGDEDYVMEFFLPPNKRGDRATRTLLYSILATMKQHFPSFKVASGKELGQELSIEIMKISKDRRPADSFQVCQITMSTPRLAVRNVGETVQLDSTNQQLMVEVDAINNERNVVGPEQNNGHDIIYFENNGLRNVGEAVQLDSTNQLSVEADAINNETSGVSPEQNNGHDVIYSENDWFAGTSMEKETGIENLITHDVLKKLFGLPINDAAKKLKVSRSTFKRICRKQGIERWPRCKKTKRNGSLAELNQPEQALEDMVIENEGASHDLRNLCPTAEEASQQGLNLELYQAGLAPGLDPHAVISTQPEASGRGVLSLNTLTTLVSGNMSSGRIARLDEIQQSLEGMVIEDVVSSRDAESRRPSVQDAFVVEEIAESSSTNFPCPGTSTTPHLLEATQGVTRKATDGMYVIRFMVSSTSGIMELKNEVAERLQLQSDTSIIMTYDVDAKELVLTTCDADLQVCLGILRSLGKHVIRLIVEPIAN